MYNHKISKFHYISVKYIFSLFVTVILLFHRVIVAAKKEKLYNFRNANSLLFSTISIQDTVAYIKVKELVNTF